MPNSPATLVGLLKLRLGLAEAELAKCLQERAWSQVAGRAGIRDALAAAVRQAAAEGKALDHPDRLNALATQFLNNSQESGNARDAALAEGAYSYVAGHDGVSVGWLIAHRVTCEELPKGC